MSVVDLCCICWYYASICLFLTLTDRMSVIVLLFDDDDNDDVLSTMYQDFGGVPAFGPAYAMWVQPGRTHAADGDAQQQHCGQHRQQERKQPQS